MVRRRCFTITGYCVYLKLVLGSGIEGVVSEGLTDEPIEICRW